MPRPAHLPPVTETVPKAGTYLAQIFAVLNTFGRTQLVPPKAPEKDSNLAVILGEAYLWDEVQSFAKKRSDMLWKQLTDEKVIPDTKQLDEGDHTLAESRRFVVTAKMTAPVKRFSADELAKIMKKEYKVPEPRTKELVESAKKGTVGQCRLAIVER